MDTYTTKTILSKTKSAASDFWFGCDYNMNLYRGCSHGCIYCDSRSDCYHIENFGHVHAKANVLPILRDELARRIKSGVVATGSMSDPYNPFEAKENITRNALTLLDAYGFGVAIATKSPLITRDIDVLQSIKEHSPVLCKITITTPHDALAQKIEPNVAPSSTRFAALEKLAKANIFSGVLLMPVLPFLQDDEKDILELVQQSANAGARFIVADFGLTMRAGQREYFLNQLEQLFPEEKLAEKYRSHFSTRYHCASPYAKKLWANFKSACNKYGILNNMQDIIRIYKQPYSQQLSLFDA